MNRNVKVISVILLSVFSACENNNSDSITAKLRFALDPGEEKTASARSSAGEGFMIDTAVLHLQRINLLARDQSGQVTNSPNPPFTGPYTIDLISHKSSPVIESSAVTPGEYCGIDAGLYIPENTKFSFYVSGTYTLNDKWWRFIYTNSGNGSFQVTDSAAFVLNETNSDIWIIIDVVKLFRGVEFGKATVSDDNIIRISETSNPSLALIIENNFRDSSLAVNNVAPQTGSDASSNQSSSGTGNQASPGSTGSDPGSSSGQGSSEITTNTSSNQTDSGKDTSATQDNSNSGSSGSVSNNDNNPGKDKDKEDGKDKSNNGKNKDKGQKSKPDHKDKSTSKNKNKQH